MTTARAKRWAKGAFLVISGCALLGANPFIGMSRSKTSMNRFLLSINEPVLVPHESPKKHEQRLVLPEITRSYENYSCPENLVYVNDTVLPNFDLLSGDQKIPRVVHMTAKSRCLTPKFAANVEKWRLPGHSFFLHDDAAIDRFVSQDFALFPHFSNVMKCITSGASKADLWRYLMIWEHGGIYTDFDNAPTKGFQQGRAIQPTDDAWFPLESLGVVAQYFFAASPKHPMMYTSLHWALMAIWNLNSISNNRAPYTTGPRATKNGFIQFLKAAGVGTNGYIPAGLYIGMNNRSVTVVGDKKNPHEFVNRQGVKGKQGQYKDMGMNHFSKQRSGQHHSCSQQMYYEYVKEMNEIPVYMKEEPTETINCGCQSTCTVTALTKKGGRGNKFTCKERIQYLMTKYGLTQTKACSEAVHKNICGIECDPHQCTT